MHMNCIYKWENLLLRLTEILIDKTNMIKNIINIVIKAET